MAEQGKGRSNLKHHTSVMRSTDAVRNIYTVSISVAKPIKTKRMRPARRHLKAVMASTQKKQMVRNKTQG